MKLPLGIQDFRQLREGNYVYVDKTENLYNVVQYGGFYFLSRPRRFGKSLLLSTLNELYRGRRELFTGLWIEPHWNWGKQHPVIWLKFSSMAYQSKGLDAAILYELILIGKTFGLDLSLHTEVKDAFRELLQTLYERSGPVVILVDEYDKPIIDYIEDAEKMDANRAILKAFHSILKDAGHMIELLFITGVSAFSQVSLFSDLNNLTNLTLSDNAATLVGITPEEMEHTFGEALQGVDRTELRRRYNGYSWDGVRTVYNPWTLLSFFREGSMKHFWTLTGTPTFLVKLMRENFIYKMNDIVAHEIELLQFNVRNFRPVPILFQTGYLTITAPPDSYGEYQLDYPNEEVQRGLDHFLLQEYTKDIEADTRVRRLRRAFVAQDLDEVFNILNSALAEIPYDHWAGADERFFHAILTVIFRMLGTPLKSEVHSSRGRLDALVELPDAVYVLEFKLDQPAAEGLAQVGERGYLAPFGDDGRDLFAVGVRLGTESKSVEEWEVVRVG